MIGEVRYVSIFGRSWCRFTPGDNEPRSAARFARRSWSTRGERGGGVDGFCFACSAVLASVPRAQWDALARRGYHRHAWFVAAEACGAEPRHVGVFDGGRLVAVIPAYIERETLHGDLHARWYGPAHRIAASLGVRASAPRSRSARR